MDRKNEKNTLSISLEISSGGLASRFDTVKGFLNYSILADSHFEQIHQRRIARNKEAR